jgi:hypothetical protein
MSSLNDLATKLVGDGQEPNMYFVTVEGETITVTKSLAVAHAEWKGIAIYLRQECVLEDRSTGVLACVEPESDEPGAKLVYYDDTNLEY